MGSDWKVILCYSITVLYRLWWIPIRAWRLPLKNGERYFQDIEVPEGWHTSAEGRKWWRRYRATIIVPHALEACGLMAIALWGQWKQLPMLSLVAPVFVGMTLAFIAWWRHANRARIQRPQRVAVSLEERKLRTYFSWSLEAALAMLIAASWAIMAWRGDADIHWRWPLTLTYVVIGLIVMKAQVVKHGWALPANRTAEYQHWDEFRRRYASRVLDRMRFMNIVILAGYAAVHSLAGVAPIGAIRGAAFAAGLGLSVWMMIGIARGETAFLRGSARSLLPPATTIIDWKKGWWSFGAFMAGLALLMFWPER
ncbi:MAG: hypothetical protein KIT09_27815 [Bryobacteraceae bacterium]|nr:hypothetical protein [Bryobacteraceae bacterium]